MFTASSDIQKIQVVLYQRVSAIDCNWRDQSNWSAIMTLLHDFADELRPLNIDLQVLTDEAQMVVRGYGDVLNSIRLRYPPAGFSNACLGHIIGTSFNRDLADDLRRGINRLLFAPETIEPVGSDKVVCHNCGCGC
ncbi:hypothetical protein [Geopsychrobacter electrodiphilus]|uniref:hypothetical protein n=1 Tax=Geopsychrobacter electrodiphilus TaxID=225196 RepID=UPI00036D9E83|nr:hypothetical protein [Geopsychrobacter electrodiphilus]